MSPYIAAPWIRHGICCWVSYGFLWFLYGFLIVFRVRIVFASQGPDPIVEVRMLCWKRTNHGFYHEFLGIYHGFTMDLS